jgi:hypothetical protein
VDLARLIDLEVQAAQDEGADAEALRARDRGIALTLDVDPADSEALVAGWLAALRARSGAPTVGERVTGALHIATGLLVALGLASGAGAAAGALAYDGTHPINAVAFFGALVLPQLALLVLLVLRLVVGGVAVRAPSGPAAGLVMDGARWLWGALARRVGRAKRDGPEEIGAWIARLHRTRGRVSLYGRVEGWSVLAATQAFAVAFNVAALGVCLARVSLSDLAFGWATTLAADAASVQRLTSWIALPWGWAWPDAVPAADLVAATRYSRLEGAYVGSGGTRAGAELAAGGWWPFLVASLVTYGLVPRAVVLALSGWMRSRALADLPTDVPHIDRIVRRLRAPRVETRGLSAEAPARFDGAAAGEVGSAPPALERRWALVAWRDVPGAAGAAGERAARALDLPAATVVGQGGGGFAEEERTLAEIRGADVGAVVVLAEAWEAPDKALLRFVRGARAAVGPERPVVVALVSADGPVSDGEAQLWREGLAALGDPWIALEVVP